jgi:hypothetical protein
MTRLLAILLVAVCTIAGTAERALADRSAWPFYWRWSHLAQPCAGDCAVAIYAGRLVETPMADIFGIDDFTPVWNWEYGKSGIVAGTVSRRFASFGPWMDFEIEGGIGKRFGDQKEGEIWGAIFARWIWFPWNHYLRTTVAVSTGLDWATGISEWERDRSGNREGSRLLHFLSPEITFADPGRPDLEFLIRLQHRSGGNTIIGPIDLFNKTGGGAQYLTAGIRWRF